MNIPSNLNLTEEQVTDLIIKIAKKIARNNKFSYYSIQDIEQELCIFALEALPRYKPEIAPLAVFLETHMHNRLKNFKRDKHFRHLTKCPRCDDHSCPSCCKKLERRYTKYKVTNPNAIDESSSFLPYPDSCLDTLLDDADLFAKINNLIPLRYRLDMIKLMHGKTISHHRKQRLINLVMELLDDNK